MYVDQKIYIPIPIQLNEVHEFKYTICIANSATIMTCYTQGFGAGLFWDGSGSGNLQPGAGSGSGSW